MAINFDNAQWTLGMSVSSVTLPFTCTGTNRVLIVGITAGKSSDNVTGVTYAGVSMTRLDMQTPNGGGSDRYTYTYYLTNPASGSNNIVASSSSSNDAFSVGAVSYTGCSQASTPENHTASKQSSSSTTYAPTITTAVNNCWIIGYQNHNSGTISGTSGTTFRVDGYGSFWDSNTDRSSGSNALNWSSTVSTDWRSNLISIAPAITGSSKFFQMF